MTRTLASIFTVLLTTTVSFANSTPNVVASIKPLHSLVAAVMGESGTPELVMEGQASPHGASLKPSQAKMLQDADLVFWIGHDLETFLEKPIESIGSNAKAVSLLSSPGIETHKFRENKEFLHVKHDEHAHKEEDGHDHDEKKDEHDHKAEGDGDHKDEHAHEHSGEADPHIWLDPVNAIAIVKSIAKNLTEANPAQAKLYEANAAAQIEKLKLLNGELAEILKPVKKGKYVTFHDAFQYFEKHYQLNFAGTINANAHGELGAKRAKEIMSGVKTLGKVCVFAEPQFDPKFLDNLKQNDQVSIATLDPIGASLKKGADQYSTMMRNMANSMAKCLGS